jgi:hypothetical protein
MTTSTLIDILLTNKPDLFMRSGIYDPALSDHMLIYGIINEKVRVYPHKVITFRSYKNFDLTEYQNLLSTAHGMLVNYLTMSTIKNITGPQ